MPTGTGHGVVWRSVLAELAAMPSVKLVRRGRADAWLAPATSPPGDGRPLVVQVHEVGWRDPNLRQYLQPEFADHLERAIDLSLDACTAAITPSRASARQIAEATEIPPEHIYAVPHGVDHSRFRPGLAGGREEVGAPYLLFVGVLHPRKNLDTLRTAFAELAGDGLPHALVVVGNPPADRHEPADLESRLQLPGRPGRVRLLREIDDAHLARLMAGADAFCLPSFFEGFGLPALEAMACGTPVVVSDRGALPEVVADAGLIVAPEPAAVQAALAQVLEDRPLAGRLRAAGLARAAQFSWRRTAAGWLAALRQAAAGS